MAVTASILVLWQPSDTNPFSSYLTEILRTEGYPQFRLHEMDGSSLTPAHLAGAAVVLLADGVAVTEECAALLHEYVSGGGNLIAQRPHARLAPLLGVFAEGCLSPARYLETARDHPLGRAAEAQVLQFHGAASVYRARGASVLAYLSTGRGLLGDQAAITTYQLGQGRTALFAYDLACSTVRFHQGDPRYSSTGPDPDPDGDGYYKLNDLLLHQLDTTLKHIPQADLQQDILVRLIQWMTEDRPLPRLWHFPDAEPSLVWLNGDSDSMTPSEMAATLGAVEENGGAYTLFVMERDYEALPPEHEALLRERGHSFGQHPWHSLTPSPAEMQAQLRWELQRFRERYGYSPLVNRGHCVIWVGWVESARMLAEEGVYFDLNCLGYRHLREGYINGSGLPARFVDEKGELLDIYEQCTQWSDDVTFQDKTCLPPYDLPGAIASVTRMIDESSERYHTVVNMLVHPIHTGPRRVPGTDSLPWLTAVARHCKEKGHRMIGGDEWARFHRARATVRFGPCAAADGTLRVDLRTGEEVRGLTVNLPGRLFGDRSATGATADGEPVRLVTRRLHGEETAMAVLDLRPGTDVTLEVEYR